MTYTSWVPSASLEKFLLEVNLYNSFYIFSMTYTTLILGVLGLHIIPDNQIQALSMIPVPVEPVQGQHQYLVPMTTGLKSQLLLMAYGLWLMAYGLWLMAYGLWLMAYGLWLVACGLWLVADG